MDGDNIGVLEQPQKTQLADDPDGVCFISQHAVDVLDGNLFVGLAILCRTVVTHKQQVARVRMTASLMVSAGGMVSRAVAAARKWLVRTTQCRSYPCQPRGTLRTWPRHRPLHRKSLGLASPRTSRIVTPRSSRRTRGHGISCSGDMVASRDVTALCRAGTDKCV